MKQKIFAILKRYGMMPDPSEKHFMASRQEQMVEDINDLFNKQEKDARKAALLAYPLEKGAVTGGPVEVTKRAIFECGFLANMGLQWREITKKDFPVDKYILLYYPERGDMYLGEWKAWDASFKASLYIPYDELKELPVEGAL